MLPISFYVQYKIAYFNRIVVTSRYNEVLPSKHGANATSMSRKSVRIVNCFIVDLNRLHRKKRAVLLILIIFLPFRYLFC